MAAMSHGSVHGSMHMYEDVCVLCTPKIKYFFLYEIRVGTLNISRSNGWF